MILSSRYRRTLVGALALIGTMVAAGDASAAAVGNPGPFVFNIPSGYDSLFTFKTGKQWYIHGSSNYISADLDAVGGVSNIDWNLPDGSFLSGATSVTSELQIQSSSWGVVDVPSATVEFHISAKVRFTYGASFCSTSAFNIVLSTSVWSSLGGGTCSTGYDESTGKYCVVAAGFTVPQLASSACGTHGNDINSLFDLGVSTGTRIQILSGIAINGDTGFPISD